MAVAAIGTLLGAARDDSAFGAIGLSAAGCSGASSEFGPVVAGDARVTTIDCSIGFSNDAGDVQLRMYQQDGTGTAIPTIADFAAGATDWDQGSDAFGTCLRDLDAAPTIGMQVDADNDCTASDLDPWSPIDATIAATSIVAELPLGSYTADLRFGVRLDTGQVPGSFAAPIVVEVVQPSLEPPMLVTGPSIAGSAIGGQTLTANPGTWTGSPTFTYQWRRCNSSGAACVDIAGSTAATHVLTGADVDATIRVVVTATNIAGSVNATTGQTTVVAGVAPVAGTLSITGTTTVTNVLSASLSGWTTGTPTGTTTYQWRRCNAAGASCVNIAGATASTYTLVTADVNMTIRVVVTRTNTCTTGCGSVNLTANQTAEIAGIAPVAGTTTVSGTETTGQVLTGAAGAGWTTGNPTATAAWQWQRCDSAGANCVDIAGATFSTRTLAVADVNNTLRVRLTRTNTCTIGCGSVNSFSATTGIIAGIAPTIPFVGISGATAPGQTLSVSVGGTLGTPAATETRQWRRCDSAGASCVDIAGATSSTYTLTAADLGSTIRVAVTRTNSCTSGCGSVNGTSSATAVVTKIAFVAGASAWQTGNNVNVLKPTGTLNGMVMVASVVVNDMTAGGAITPPAGWSFVRRTNHVGNDLVMATYVKVAGGAEPGNYIFTIGGSLSLLASIATFAGVDTTTPVEADVNGQGDSASPTAPSLTTVTADAVLVGTWSIHNSALFTFPGSMAGIWSSSWDASSGGAYEQRPTVGATGARATTVSGGPDRWIGHALALRPAP